MAFNSLEYAIFLAVVFAVFWLLQRAPLLGVLLVCGVAGVVFAALSFQPNGLDEVVQFALGEALSGQMPYEWTTPSTFQSLATVIPPLILAMMFAVRGPQAMVLRIAFLVMASYIFYAASNPWFLLLIMLSTATDFFAGLGMADTADDAKDIGPNKRMYLSFGLGSLVGLSLFFATDLGLGVSVLVGGALGVAVLLLLSATKSARKQWLVFSLVVNLGLLGAFKYADFFWESVVESVNYFSVVFSDLPAELAREEAPLIYEKLGILLPAGISFYTFQTMSYSIDLYRKRCPPERSFLRFAFFVSYFPQLVAGPIVRAVDFLPQIGKRPILTRQQASRALFLIMIGLFKKALADYLGGNMVDRVFEHPLQYGSFDSLLGLYGYTMQVYLDFSAYSDIAIGSALLFGFHLPDNFDRPYMAHNIQDFWRRWHQTLGSWLRDYLYYPLGGSKGSDARTYFNLSLTFILIGLWHGPDWRFVVYGCCHALAMCVHRFVRVNLAGRKKAVMTKPGLVFRIALTLNFVVFARVLFRSPTWGKVGEYFGALGGSGAVPLNVKGLDLHERLYESWGIDLARYWDGSGAFGFYALALLVLTFVVHWTPRGYVRALGHAFERAPIAAQGAIFTAAAMLTAQIADGTSAFIYFQF